jgi:hypothetical protein
MLFEVSMEQNLNLNFPPKISATALEETKILVWHRDKLKLILTMCASLLNFFSHCSGIKIS